MEIAADFLECVGCKNAQALLVERKNSTIKKDIIVIILEIDKVENERTRRLKEERREKKSKSDKLYKL